MPANPIRQPDGRDRDIRRFAITSLVLIGIPAAILISQIQYRPNGEIAELGSMIVLAVAPLLGVSLFVLSCFVPRASRWRSVLRFMAWAGVVGGVLVPLASFVLVLILLSHK